MNARSFKSSNTVVTVLPNVTIMTLFGNDIAFRYNDPENTLSITNAGWNSLTTKERLNGIDGVNISAKRGKWYLNGIEWDGELIDIKEEESELSSQLRSVSTVASLGKLLGFNTEENNDFRVRILKAGLPAGALNMPEDWDTLSEEEKDRRLTLAVQALKD